MNAQVDKSRFPGGCFDVDAPLLEGQLEDTVVDSRIGNKTICEGLMGGFE